MRIVNFYLAFHLIMRNLKNKQRSWYEVKNTYICTFNKRSFNDMISMSEIASILLQFSGDSLFLYGSKIV